MSEVRLLGFWESLCDVYYNNFRCSGLVFQSARLFGRPEDDAIRAAFAMLANKHPFLRASIKAYADDPCYNQLCIAGTVTPDAPFEQLPVRLVSRVSEDGWRDVAEKMMIEGMQSDLLWEVTFLKGGGNTHDMVVLLHHSVGDAASTVRIVQDFCDLLAKATSDGFQAVTPLPAMEAVERLIPRETDTTSGSGVSPQGVDTRELEPWPFQSFAPLEQRTTRNLYQRLDAKLMGDLRAKCKEHGVKINGLVTAAILSVTAKKREQPYHVVLSNAVNLRLDCQPTVGSEHLGCYVMIIPTKHTMNPDDSIWDLAKTCEVELKNEIEAKRAEGFLPLAYDQRILEQGMKQDLESSNQNRVFPSGLGLSNLGVVTAPSQYGPFQLDSLYFCSAQVAGNFNLVMNLLSFEGDLFCCFSYTEHLVERAYIQQVVCDFVSTLKQCSE